MMNSVCRKKAIELIDKFDHISGCDLEKGQQYDIPNRLTAKICALVCIDEQIDDAKGNLIYLTEVRKAIEEYET